MTSSPPFPVESITCPHCLAELRVDDGVDPRDLLWLHQRRCNGEELFPEMSIVCGLCQADMPVEDGINPVEVLWLHDLECPEGLAGLSFAS